MPDSADIAAIILAAGDSSRFGSDKLRHPLTLHGVTRPLAAQSLLPWLEVFAHISVVVKPEAVLFCNAVAISLGVQNSAKIRWVTCAHADQGMASSLICGVNANSHASGWLIGLADMPAVPAAAITGVRNALQNGAELAAPYREGRRGHPVGISALYKNELLMLEGDTGARRILERDPSKVIQIECNDAGIMTDIDIPGDLHQL